MTSPIARFLLIILVAIGFVFFVDHSVINPSPNSSGRDSKSPISASDKPPVLEWPAKPVHLVTNKTSSHRELVKKNQRSSKSEKLVFQRFSDWCSRYTAATNSSARQELEIEGIQIATERQVEMLDLIAADPEHALLQAIPRHLRGKLPLSLVALIEEPLSGRGDFGVLAAIGKAADQPPTTPLYRTVSLGERAWRAYTFGVALERSTLTDIPLHGIALGGLFALDPNPIRRLESEEREQLNGTLADAVCSVAGTAAAEFGTATAIDTGGEIAWLCGDLHLQEVTAKALAGLNDSGNGLDVEGTFRMKSAYTGGIKRLLILRVDFSDLPGVPLSAATATNMLAGINSFYREQSFGKTGFQPLGSGSALTATLRMPKTAAVYGAGDASLLRTDARAAARTAGFNTALFDFDLICMGAVPGFNWAGLGYIGAPGAWIRSSFDASGGVPSHELGHNLGLLHANFWDTGGQSVTGAGSNVAYGDSFDTMGNAGAGKRHFNARYKNYLGWMPTAEVRTVTSSGTYRVWAHDLTNAATTRALRIAKNNQTNYWLEFRQQFTDRPALMSGLGLRWARSGNQSSLLLDTTPGTADGKNDSALLIGRTFSDTASDIHITPVAKGGTVPESLDVVIQIGRFTNNLPPIALLAASSTSLPVNGVVTLTATATDPEKDPLAYSWDFGDGTIIAANTPKVTHAWTTVGEYVAYCRVSDMKGGVAIRSIPIRVGNPTTVRIAGQVTRGGHPLQGIRVEVSNTRQAYTDSDGFYTLTGLTRGIYTVKAISDGLMFNSVGFTNPVSVQANQTGVDFESFAAGDLATVSIVPLGAQWRYYDKGNLTTSAWRQSSFDDTGWSRGAAPLGYGDDNIITTVGYGGVSSAKYITTWFRHSFRIDDLSGFQSITLGLIRDDGAAVYLNGREIFRSNMPTGTLLASTLASSATGGTDETALFEAELPSTLFVGGSNILAVEVHQSSTNSSDMRFNLRISGLLRPTQRAPAIVLTPQSGSLRIAWTITAIGYVLQESDVPDGLWQLGEGPMGTEAGLNFTVVSATNSTRFFRLSKP